MARETHVGIVNDYHHVTGHGSLVCEETGRTVSFHINQQVEFIDNGREPEGRPPSRLRQPATGDRIFFNVGVTKHPRAAPWGFADAWEKIWMKIECRKLGIPF